MKLSIDLQAEIATITGRQHLNQVHFAVQLVRAALLGKPRTVRVKSTRTHFELAHDGAPWPAEELALIELVLSPRAQQQRQDALSDLELRYGVALLSLVCTADAVEVLSTRSLAARGGALVPPRDTHDDHSTVIRVQRRRQSAREERDELRGYCRYADCAFFFNGRKLSEPLALDGAFLPRTIETKHGTGLLGLSPGAGLSRVAYFKHGVYYGLRQHVAEDGLPSISAWNSSVPVFEANFRTSTTEGDRALADASASLLADLARTFPTLTMRQKMKLRTAVVSSPPSSVPPAMRALPLFDLATLPFARSIDDLAAECRARGFVAYAPRGYSPAATHLPLLRADDVLFLERLLGKAALRRALVVDRGVFGVLRRLLERTVDRLERVAVGAAGDHPAPLPDRELPHDVLRLREALPRAGVKLVVVAGRTLDVEIAGGGLLVTAGVDALALKRSAAAVALAPDALDAAAALLASPVS